VGSLSANTTGSNNTAQGYNALNANTTGAQNTAFGEATMSVNTTGSNNTAIGKNALQSNTSGSQNTAIGLGAGSTNSQGTGNIFVGYMAGSQETGSNKLYIDNSSTTAPLIYGDFDTDSLTLNGDVKVTGTLSADTVKSSTGKSVMHFEEATGAVHIGENSMVFYDSAGAIGNGTDIMASSVGKIQIGKQSTDVTSFVGEVNVPEPTKPSHAVTKQYSDNSTAMSMAMASSLNSQHKGHHFGIGFSEFGGQTAMAIGLSFDYEKGNFNFAISETDLMEEPAYSGGFSWSF
jgi:hypothetical protein